MGWVEEATSGLVETYADRFEHPTAMAAAAVEPGSRSAISSGSFPDALYEIGSIGKTVTALMLARLVVDGVVSLDDPISRWLGDGKNRHVTLEQLATHTSGLPRLDPFWKDRPDFDEQNPYAYLTAEVAVGVLDEIDPLSTPAESEYSNFGFSLLGHVLALAAGATYEEALQRLVCEPLGLTDTTTEPTDRVPQGYANGSPVKRWTQPLPAAGGHAMSADDLARYMEGHLNPPDGPIGDAVRLALEPRLASGSHQISLAWHHSPDGMIWHNGGVAGASSAMFLHPETGRGAAACIQVALDANDPDIAVAHTVMGRDPRLTRAETIDADEIAVPTAEVLQAAADGRWDDITARFSGSLAEQLTVEMLDGGWREVMGGRGDYQGCTVTNATRRLDGLVTAEVELTFSGEPGGATLHWTPTGELAGILIR